MDWGLSSSSALYIAAQGVSRAGWAAISLRVQVKQCARKPKIRARLRRAVGLLAESRRRRAAIVFRQMKTPKENSDSAAGVGAGAVAAALAAAGVDVSSARRTLGAESQSLGQLLKSGERPAGPLLQAVQAQLDRELCEWCAFNLNAKMVRDGRESLWLRDDGRGAGWCATMADAISDGLQALAMWRAGQTLARDDSGADVLALGELGGVCAVWVKTVAGDAVKIKLSTTAARIAWRAVVESVARDTFGETPAQAAFARAWVEWSSGARDWRGLTPEQRARRRLASVESMRDKLASGRGRRAALADKVKHAALLMLNGTSADEAAAAAGFKASDARGRSGRTTAAQRLASSLRRAGLPVTATRGAWAQDMDEFEQARRRGAAVDLAKLWGGVARYDAPAVQPVKVLRAGTWCGASCFGAAIVRGVKRKRRAAAIVAASSGRDDAASAGMMAGATSPLQPLPLLPGQVRRIVRAAKRRTLRGVLRRVN